MGNAGTGKEEQNERTYMKDAIGPFTYPTGEQAADDPENVADYYVRPILPAAGPGRIEAYVICKDRVSGVVETIGRIKQGEKENEFLITPHGPDGREENGHVVRNSPKAAFILLRNRWHEAGMPQRRRNRGTPVTTNNQAMENFFAELKSRTNTGEGGG